MCEPMETREHRMDLLELEFLVVVRLLVVGAQNPT